MLALSLFVARSIYNMNVDLIPQALHRDSCFIAVYDTR